MNQIKFSRVWAMPSSDTFDCLPIGNFVRRWMEGSKCSVDPFARNKRWATHTNDLNPATKAEHHFDALEFLAVMEKKGVQPDLVIFDPPYSARQIAECYEQVGRKTTMQDTQGRSWTRWKSAIARLVRPNGVVLSFGWNTVGMGNKHGFNIEEIMLVCHGGVHNDTICMAERRIIEQKEFIMAVTSR
jgi:hypothetical protein